MHAALHHLISFNASLICLAPHQHPKNCATGKVNIQSSSQHEELRVSVRRSQGGGGSRPPPHQERTAHRQQQPDRKCPTSCGTNRRTSASSGKTFKSSGGRPRPRLCSPAGTVKVGGAAIAAACTSVHERAHG